MQLILMGKKQGVKEDIADLWDEISEDQKKKLIAGLVLTGLGSHLRHLKQLVEYIT